MKHGQNWSLRLVDGKDTDTHQSICMKDLMHIGSDADDEMQFTADFSVDAHALLADYIVPSPQG